MQDGRAGQWGGLGCVHGDERKMEETLQLEKSVDMMSVSILPVSPESGSSEN